MHHWSPGDSVAWRCRIRTPWGAKDDLSYVFPMTVVRDDEDEVVVLRRPGHVSKARNADLTSPLRRTRVGFDFVENGLDIVVGPDLSSWHWKDDAALEWEVEHGMFTRAEADELYREGQRALARLRDERHRSERWRSWRPDPSWPLAALPEGWDGP